MPINDAPTLVDRERSGGALPRAGKRETLWRAAGAQSGESKHKARRGWLRAGSRQFLRCWPYSTDLPDGSSVNFDFSKFFFSE